MYPREFKEGEGGVRAHMSIKKLIWKGKLIINFSTALYILFH
jgi:hypothetical protein